MLKVGVRRAKLGKLGGLGGNPYGATLNLWR
jgi:hypothetical protein